MRTLDDLLSDLRSLDVKVWADGEDLRYKAPSKTITPTLRQELKERKAEILAFLSNANAAFSGNVSPILPVPRSQDLPLSFAQQRLWFIDQLEPGNYAYNIRHAYRLTGQLNITALKQSLNEIVHRHEALRTNFPSENGQPKQVILEDVNLTLPVIDLREFTETEKQAETERISRFFTQQPFNLATDLLFRAQLLWLEESEYLLLFSMHHIVSDGWSMDVLFRELTTLYSAFATNKPSLLPALPIQYADFAVWQRQWLQGEVLESQLSYWKQQFNGRLPILQLPTDYPRPPVQTYKGAYQSLELSPELTEALKVLSQQEGVTLFMTLLAAFKTLLYRYTAQEDIIVGTPIAGRNQVATEGLIGFFVNSVAMRTQLVGDLTFRQLLSKVREVTLGAYSHQDLPLEKLIEELQPERDRSRSPLFQVMFVLQNTPKQSQKVLGLTFTPQEVDNGTAKFDLILILEETATGIKGGIEYNTDLFEAATITRMQGHLQTLLAGIVANPEQHLKDLPLITPAEKHQLLVEFNQTQTNYPHDLCIHQLFEMQVERSPNAVALVDQNRQLTYLELNTRANQLAAYLRSLGVTSEVLVGICVERSIEAIVGILAILKAGGAYVPLDPEYPQERLQFILDDTHVKVLLTQEKLLKSLVENQAHVVCLDTDWHSISSENQDNLNNITSPENLSYVIYTSGSTGKPKGVAVTHQAVNRLVLNTNYIQLTPDDRVAQAANMAFDAATFEIWGALLNGAKVVIMTKSVLLSPQEFAANIRRYEVSVIFLTTALFNQLASFVPQAFSSLRCLLFGGEAVDPRWVQEVLDKGAPQQLLHVYGPTENTTFSSWYLVENLPNTATTIPIGRPISNTEIYLLDQNLQPVPIGIPGELYLGGAGLARGYLNRPELTQEKFIPNPFSSEAHSYLYKTGDLVRYRGDGNIEFIGRIDYQVKIRGFRIELGEIEAVLTQHPCVQQTVVIVREDNPGDKRLVAYVVLEPEKTATTEELRLFVKEKLPEYMVPSYVVILDSLPLTANGKVDRRALPEPDLSNQKLEENFLAPRDELELQLTKIWEKVLGIQPISIRDNFFDLGGHSLLGVSLMSEIGKLFHNSLSLATLFESPTVEQMAKVLRSQKLPSPWYSLVAIQPGGSQPPLFGIHHVYFNDLARHLGSQQPVYALHYGMGESTNKAIALPKIEDLAAHYIQEMRTLQPQGPYYLMGLSFGGVVAFEMAQQLVAQGQEIGLLALFDTYIEDRRKLLPLRQRLSNLLTMSPDKILTIAQKKVRNKILRLRYGTQYLPHIYLPEPTISVFKVYTPKTYSGRVVLFKATDVSSISYSYDPPELGWRKFVDGEVEVYEVPGGHLGILEEPHVQVVAKKMKDYLQKGQTNS